MKGYYKDQKRTDELIWTGPRNRTYLRSGDLGRLDEDGYLYICGRIKDMIKSGGINVFPSDIEAVFAEHPAVREAAAVAIPHPKWMETPLLFVILNEGARVGAAELMAWGNKRLGKFQCVSAVEIVAEFPRVTYGKVDKGKLRAPYWEGRENAI
jgi:acyl-CoA synthetase (AMP-forming)/AMP-acid ligase II